MEIQKVKLQMIKDNDTIYTLDTITAPTHIVELINAHERYDLSPTEKIIVIAMDNKNKINTYAEIATGVAGYANFNMSNLFKTILLSNGNKFILVHNHPSGDATPSKEDFDITEKVKDASKIMGIQFLDHIVIGENNSYTSIMSIREEVK